MKRILPNFLCFFILMASFSIISYAEVITINSPMTEPIPTIVNNGNGTSSYKQYYVVQYTNSTSLYELNFTIPSDKSCIFRLNHAQFVTINTTASPNEITNIKIYRYNVIDGSLIEDYTTSPATDSFLLVSGYNSAIKFRTGYFPKNSASDTSVLGCYPITSIETYGTNALTNTSPFVVWSVSPLSINHYTSFVSEPVADDLNRYFVLAGEDHKYLYAIRYHLQEYSTIVDSFVNNQFFWLRLINYMVPKILKDENNISLSLYCDPQLLSIIDDQSQSTTLSYGITIAQYDLETGQFINSSNYNDLSIGVNEISLAFDFGSVSDYDSAQFWGVYYNDEASQLHYNLLSCTWAVDPDFVYWQSQVIDYLDRIYNILNQTAEDVTIDADMSAVDEGKSARDSLKVTDSNGQTVDAAAQVENAFSEAASGFGSLGDSVTGINGLINQMFFRHAIVVLPVIVALALGLLVTILGKNKSD